MRKGWSKGLGINVTSPWPAFDFSRSCGGKFYASENSPSTASFPAQASNASTFSIPAGALPLHRHIPEVLGCSLMETGADE